MIGVNCEEVFNKSFIYKSEIATQEQNFEVHHMLFQCKVYVTKNICFASMHSVEMSQLRTKFEKVSVIFQKTFLCPVNSKNTQS